MLAHGAPGSVVEASAKDIITNRALRTKVEKLEYVYHEGNQGMKSQLQIWRQVGSITNLVQVQRTLNRWESN